MKAATEPVYRAEFYRQLMTAELVVLTDGKDAQEGQNTLVQDTQVNIMTLQDGRIPVFSATNRIFDNGVIKEQVPYMQMASKDLLNMTQNATLVLNPYSDYGKELVPNEINSILDGTIHSKGNQITIEKDTEIQIGQPANYPTDLVSSLKKLFANKSNVNAAYLAQIHNPESGDPPHLLIGIDADGELTAVSQDAGMTAQQFLKDGELVDFIKIDKSGGVSDYFLQQTKPFYEKK